MRVNPDWKSMKDLYIGYRTEKQTENGMEVLANHNSFDEASEYFFEKIKNNHGIFHITALKEDSDKWKIISSSIMYES